MAFAEAKGLYEEWHQFEPEDILDIDIPEPEGELQYLGLLKRLDYMSDKWNQNEKVYYYHHFRKGWPRLYVDQKGNYFIYGYIRVTPDGIDDWLKPQIFEWKKPNVKKGVSKLGVLELLNWEDENGKTHTKMFGDRYYVGNPTKDFTYISTAMLENPKSKPVAVRQLEMIVRDIRKDKRAMKVLERALGNLPHRNPIPIPTQAIAANAFLKSIVTGVSTATFGVGITATILGSLLVNFLLNTIKNRVSPPTMPPPPKWVMNMTKSYVAAGVKDPKDITDRIQEIWNQQTFEAKVGIYEGEYGKAEEDEEADVEEPDVEGVEATENPDGSGTTKIFVYGSLRKGGYNAHRIYGRRPDFLGAIKTETGTIKGELRAFNMIGVDTKGEGTVIGELVTFDERFTPEVLKRMDGFEGAYNRVEVEVTLEDGRKEKAWVYEVKQKGEGSDWAAAGRWGGIHIIRHGDYLKYIKEDCPREQIKQDRERKRREPYEEFLKQSKHGPQLLMEHEEWKVRKAESEREQELRRDEETLRVYGHRRDDSEENPDKKEYTKEELELKALEMVFRWAYNKVIKEPGEAFSFFRRKGIDVAFSAVQHAFTMGKTRRHKDDARKGKGGGDLPYIANPITSKSQWRLFKSRYPQLFEDWQAHYPVKYGDLPERAEENPLILGDSFVCGNCRRRMPGREKHPQVPDLCRACGDWAIAEGYASTTAENPSGVIPGKYWRTYTAEFSSTSRKVIQELPVGKVHIVSSTPGFALCGEMLINGDYVERPVPEDICRRCAKKRENPLKYADYKEAVGGEGWAINDYAGMIAEADTDEEREVLQHIRKEEEEHLDELTMLMRCKKGPRQNPTAWSSPDGRWRVEEWGPQDFTVVEILSTDPVAAALGEDARVWPARFKTIQGAVRKASKLAGVAYTAENPQCCARCGKPIPPTEPAIWGKPVKALTFPLFHGRCFVEQHPDYAREFYEGELPMHRPCGKCGLPVFLGAKYSGDIHGNRVYHRECVRSKFRCFYCGREINRESDDWVKLDSGFPHPARPYHRACLETMQSEIDPRGTGRHIDEFGRGERRKNTIETILDPTRRDGR